MKNLINTILFVVVIFTTLIIVKGYDNPSSNQSNVSVEKVSEVLPENVTASNEDSESINKNVNNSQVINIVGLGDLDNSILEKASQIIKDFYGINTNIKGNVDITTDLCLNNDTLDADKCVFTLTNDIKTIYITNSNLYTKGGMRLRGYTTINGNTVVVRSNPEFIKETIIHELGHTFGLSHCDDLTCIMAIANDDYDSGDFCPKCKNIINNN